MFTSRTAWYNRKFGFPTAQQCTRAKEEGNKLACRSPPKLCRNFSHVIPSTLSEGNSSAYQHKFHDSSNVFDASSSSSIFLPNFVSEKLKNIKSDVINYLIDRQVPHLEPVVESPTNFTKNLQEMAQYYFSHNGKLIRPTISLLMSSACNILQGSSTIEDSITLDQYRIAIVSEMIHTASLIHDDVIDQSDLRRGCPTANARWGNRQAVLVGDFILARATKVLCMIGKPDVISTMAEIVEDLVKGELMQMNPTTNVASLPRFQHYMLKNFYKTGSLFMNSCKSVAILGGCNECIVNIAAQFGRNLGLAFQIVDDVLDYESTSSALGKPTVNDLKQGLATCPVLYAAEEHPELNQLIDRKFSKSGDEDLAYEIVLNSRGLTRSRELASRHVDSALELAKKLPDGDVRRSLMGIVINVGNRQQ